ncbi:hypothetical protein [Actinopolymorpha pittospori]
MVFQPAASNVASRATDLPPVIWLGGGSGAGKTTISRAIAYRFDLAWYRIDAHGYAHRDRLIANGKLSADAAAETHDQRWLESTPEDLASSFIEGSEEEFPLILEDLRTMAADIAVIVEGPQLLPQLVAPYLSDPDCGLWLLPTPEFQRTALAARFNASQSTSDAERAQEKLLTRNSILDGRTRSEATALALRVVDVDGQRDLPTMIEHVTELLKPALTNVPRARTGRQRQTLRRTENDAMVANVKAWLADIAPRTPPDPLLLPFACECAQLGCAAEVEQTPADYQAMRTTDGLITAPHHATPADKPEAQS